MKRSILFHTLCVLVVFLFTSVITVFGSNVTNEFEKVLALAEQGDAAAQYNLGVMYAKGQGVAKDFAEAMKWYRKSAEQGNARAQINLGYMYAAGRGVAQDYSEAMKWYTKAAEQGNARAQYNLGYMYENGHGVTQDYSEAMKWYTKAAEQGSRFAQARLVFLKNGFNINRFNITTEIIEGYWTSVLENATRISVDPRSMNTDSKEGEGILEAFGMQYMPNAYEYYQEVRAKAIEREQIFKENFPEGEKSDSTGGELYTEIMKATAKAVGEYFRRRDELCHFYLMHKAGIMDSQELMKLDEAKISMLLPAIGSEFVTLKSEVSEPTATERTFAEKYMPSTLAAYERISKQIDETLELRKALLQDYSILYAVRGNLALNVVASRFNHIVVYNNFLVSKFKDNLLHHRVEEITAEKLAKQDEELSVVAQGFEKKLPIHDYGKEWLSKNWTDREKRDVILREAPIFTLRLSMVEIPGKDYMMSKYEVTQRLWEAVMGKNPSKFSGGLTRPVEFVSLDDIQEFLKKLNALPEVKASGLEYRLPTAYEWEYACRAGATGDYCKLADGTEITKETLGDVAWFKDNSNGGAWPVGRTWPVGLKKPNAYGLYDMHGNVWEWTSTITDDCWYIRCGGSWDNSSGNCLSSSRDRDCSYRQYDYLGFRLCASRRADKAQEGK